MVISYEIEKSFEEENRCFCSVLNNNVFEEKSYRLSFDLTDSPVDGNKKINITLPVAARHSVARKLGATIMSPQSGHSIFEHTKRRTKTGSVSREVELISRKTMKNIVNSFFIKLEKIRYC